MSGLIRQLPEHKNFSEGNTIINYDMDRLIWHFKQPQYIILGSNRTAELFSTYEANACINKAITDKVFTYNKIDIIGKEFLYKSVLLVLDVSMLGRTAVRIWESINKYNPLTIDTIFLYQQIELPDYFYFKTQTDYTHIRYLPGVELRRYSNCVNEYIHSLNQPPRTCHYCYTKQKYSTNLTESPFLQNITMKNVLQHQEYNEGQEPQYFKFNGFKDYPFVKFAFVKVYHSNVTAESNVIPYIILDIFSKDELNIIWNNIFDEFPEEFRCIRNPKDIYRALTEIIANCCISMMFPQSKNKLCFSDTDRSFLPNFIDIVNAHIKDNILDYIKTVWKQKEPIKETNTIMSSCISKAAPFCKGTPSFCQDAISIYLYLVHTNEDKYFMKAIESGCVKNKLTFDNYSLKKTSPINIYQIFDMFPETTKTKELATFLFMEDCYMVETTVCQGNTDTKYENLIYTGVRIK